MNNADVKALILGTALKEEPVTVPEWEGANLFIRELDGASGLDLLAACREDDKLSQKKLVAAVLLGTLRNADEQNKALVFAKADDPNAYDPVYFDSLMSTGLGRLMSVANQSMKLSGLSGSGNKDAKND